MWKGRLNETCPPNYVNNTNVGREVQGTQQCVHNYTHICRILSDCDRISTKNHFFQMKRDIMDGIV